jgi:hypothetical protein
MAFTKHLADSLVPMSLHLKCRVHYRDADFKICTDMKPMLLYGSMSYKSSGARKDRTKFTYFSVRGEEPGSAVYRFLCCMVPQEDASLSITMPSLFQILKPFIVAQRLIRSSHNAFFDVNRGGLVRSSDFRFTHYT